MGKHNGSWSPIYGQAWTHAKTLAACEWLVENGKRISPDFAPFLVLGWLNRLCIWCIDNRRADGSLAGLTPARLAAIAWPEAIEGGARASTAGETMLGALRVGGFVEGEPATIHDFYDHHGALLALRRVNENVEHQRAAGKASAAARRARDGHALPPNAPNRTGSIPPNPTGTAITEPGGYGEDRTRRVEQTPYPLTGPDLTGPSVCADQTTQQPEPERGYAATEPPSLSEPNGPGRSRSQEAAQPPDDEDAARAAAETNRRWTVVSAVRYAIDCSPIQAAESVEQLAGWGMTLDQIHDAAKRTTGGKQKPWEWRARVHKQHLDATNGSIA